jgi:hypothetical protein
MSKIGNFAASHAKIIMLRCNILYCNAACFCKYSGNNKKRNLNMTLTGIFAQIKDRRAKRAQFLRMVDEINSLSHSDLVDIRADRTEMLRHAYLEVYGDRAA